MVSNPTEPCNPVEHEDYQKHVTKDIRNNNEIYQDGHTKINPTALCFIQFA
jgi:hypothetical protein